MTIHSKPYSFKTSMHTQAGKTSHFSQSKTSALDSLRGNSIRRHGIANLAGIVSKLNLLKASRAILLQGHLAHLRLAAITSKLELHNSPSSSLDQLNHLVDLVYEAVLEELAQASLVDKVGVARDDEAPRHLARDGVAAVLDAVVRDLDAVALDVEPSGPGDAEERLGGLGGEEDDFGGGGLMGHVVGVVDVAAPDAADVADGGEELVGGHAGGQVGEPESAVLLGGEMLGAGVGFGVHAVISSRELGRTEAVAAGFVGEDSGGSLLHYCLHGQEAMRLFMGVDVDIGRDLDGRRRRDRLSNRVSSGRREAEDVDSKRLSVVDFGRSSRA